MPKQPLFGYFLEQMACLMYISCFIALFFLIGLVLEPGVSGYSTHFLMPDVYVW